ncbi:MAG: 2Fe-2S iron-sulfur cluster-binding protein, partial [Pseudomonadota bacterium]
MRLSSGGIIERTRPVTFSFDNKQYQGFQGDTLASALLANGVFLMGRSFKYHRPRGVVCDSSAEPNALVSVGSAARSEPNTRATMVEIYEGMEAYSQNCFPSLQWDFSAWVGMISSLFPSGFYYKTFMWPKSFWLRYEWIIRHMAGLGTASRA